MVNYSSRYDLWTVSSAGRASAWRAGGHRFESCTVHQNKSLWLWSGAFLLRHPLTHVGAGRYRTRTARPRRRRGNKHPSGVFVSARFLTRRNVYQERCRQTHPSQVFLFWWAVQDENRDKQRQGITMRAISCLLIFLTRRGILGLVQQIEICEGALWTNI